MAKRKLIVGKKYNIKLPYGIAEGYYYTGKRDSLCCQSCDCCGKELMNGHLFMKPFGNANYNECINGNFAGQVALGITCINKVEIMEYI